MRHLRDLDFSQTPFVAIWEVTRACDLACRHCRAEAINKRNPDELSTEEGYDLIDKIRSMGTHILVLSGGDPVKREDIFDLIRYGALSGLRMATIPAATQALTPELVRKLKEAGLSQIAFSLDGPDRETHDSFRGTPGAFDLTMKGAWYARTAELPLQINTTFGVHNIDRFEEIAALVKDLGVVFWEVFFLVPTGRGRLLKQMKAYQHEKLFEKLYEFSKEVDFIVKITEAQHYRRYVMERETREKSPGAAADLPERLTRDFGPGGSIGLAPKGVNSGNGFVFISHTGEVFPSGFLPISAGNVRNESIVDIYRNSPLFVGIRDYRQLKGKCGMCEWKYICGGSRARAYALTGDYMESESGCAFVPEGFGKRSQRGACVSHVGA
ncbi:MAG: TIGR04053 family radical SAM/SPASM domain-containing protein [Candidatus Dadabacteria bacterium]